MNATKGKLLYAQSGGVTAVINASAAAVIETCRKHKVTAYAARNGILGALREDLIDTTKESPAAIRALKHTPGGAFGSCRVKLKSLEDDRARYERLIDVLRAHDIRYFLYNGGNEFHFNADYVLAGDNINVTRTGNGRWVKGPAGFWGHPSKNLHQALRWIALPKRFQGYVTTVLNCKNS